MVKCYDEENQIFIISEKFEKIQSEIFENKSTGSPITIARTHLGPEVSTWVALRVPRHAALSVMYVPPECRTMRKKNYTKI